MKHREAIKMSGVKYFTFADMSKATGNFDTSAVIGKGGYGRVYKGILTDGVIVAIKRAQEDSMQGSKEFYTEIELLSRVHHRNLVSLVGYCDDDGEQVGTYTGIHIIIR
jgi:serine/threonine protein kinase